LVYAKYDATVPRNPEWRDLATRGAKIKNST